MTRYRESFRNDDDPDDPEENPDYSYLYEDDELYEDLYPRRPEFYVHWDMAQKRWTCTCPYYRRDAVCRHTRNMRRQETIRVKDQYL